MPTKDGFLYPSTVMDAWSRSIVGWSMRDTLHAEGSVAAHRIRQSICHARDCYDNAMAESRFSTLKRELTYHETYGDRAQVRAAVFQWKTMYYQRTRLHSALGYLSPAQFEERHRRVG